MYITNMLSLPIVMATVFKVLVVRGLTSYNINDLCTPTLTPSLHLRSETTLLVIPAALNLTHQCDVTFTWDDPELYVQVSSDPENITGMSLPCDWISGEWDDSLGSRFREHICPHKVDHITWQSLYGNREFKILVKSTNGLEERTRDLTLILTPVYYPCHGYDDDGTATYSCCHHGNNETTEDFGECVDITGSFWCLHKSMFCDGVVNCALKNDENCTLTMTDGGSVVATGGGWVVLAGWWFLCQ